MAIITISRLTGSGGREIATATADALGFQFIERDAMDAVISQQFPVRLEELSRIKQDKRVYDEMVRSAIAEVVRLHNVVDLVLNLDRFSNEVAVRIIAEAAKTKGIEVQAVELPPQLRETILTAKLDVAQLADIQPEAGKLPDFAHSSEREFARVMDFYRIR